MHSIPTSTGGLMDVSRYNDGEPGQIKQEGTDREERCEDFGKLLRCLLPNHKCSD